MSSTTLLRHHAVTFSFIPRQRELQVSNGLKRLKLRASRRQVKRSIRLFLTRFKSEL